MSAIRGRDTSVERMLRRELRSSGILGYRCSPPQVFGRPDVAFTRWKVAVFVDGCFWHGCPTCYVRPSDNRDFWDEKLAVNRARDLRVDQELGQQGWDVLRFWEHEIRSSPEYVVAAVRDALCLAGRLPA